MFNLRKLRRNADVGLNKAASELSVTPATLWRWESDVHTPPITILPTIVKLYRLTDEEILSIVKEQAS